MLNSLLVTTSTVASSPIRARRGGMLLGVAAACAVASGMDVAYAASSSSLVRPLSHEASAVVALHPSSVTPVSPDEKPTRMQDYQVRGVVTACLKGPLRLSESVLYSLTAEGRPDQLAEDHIAFLRRASSGGWVAVDGPALPDTPVTRRDILRLTKGCR